MDQRTKYEHKENELLVRDIDAKTLIEQTNADSSLHFTATTASTWYIDSMDAASDSF